MISLVRCDLPFAFERKRKCYEHSEETAKDVFINYPVSYSYSILELTGGGFKSTPTLLDEQSALFIPRLKHFRFSRHPFFGRWIRQDTEINTHLGNCKTFCKRTRYVSRSLFLNWLNSIYDLVSGVSEYLMYQFDA